MGFFKIKDGNLPVSTLQTATAALLRYRGYQAYRACPPPSLTGSTWEDWTGSFAPDVMRQRIGVGSQACQGALARGPVLVVMI